MGHSRNKKKTYIVPWYYKLIYFWINNFPNSGLPRASHNLRDSISFSVRGSWGMNPAILNIKFLTTVPSGF